MENVLRTLMAQREEPYAQFQRKLLPTVEPERILGVRTPALRKLAKEFHWTGEWEAFLADLPHTYFEENLLHGFLISEYLDFPSCIQQLELFLPYVDNWAVCDQTSPKCFRRHRQELLPELRRWLSSSHPYTVRFAIGMLMRHFLEEDFRAEYLEWVAALQWDHYYVNMEIAWYLATALAKQWDATIPYLQSPRLSPWVHNRTIQKARESFRITPEQKAYLATLKWPNRRCAISVNQIQCKPTASGWPTTGSSRMCPEADGTPRAI